MNRDVVQDDLLLGRLPGRKDVSAGLLARPRMFKYNYFSVAS